MPDETYSFALVELAAKAFIAAVTLCCDVKLRFPNCDNEFNAFIDNDESKLISLSADFDFSCSFVRADPPPDECFSLATEFVDDVLDGAGDIEILCELRLLMYLLGVS